MDSLAFSCYKETNDVSLYQMMSAFSHFWHTLNRLFNNCIKLYWNWISYFFLLEILRGCGGRGGQFETHRPPPSPEKTTLKKPSLIRVKRRVFDHFVELALKGLKNNARWKYTATTGLNRVNTCKSKCLWFYFKDHGDMIEKEIQLFFSL